MKAVERYDPNKPVCDNQADFNVAVKNAINDMSGNQSSYAMYSVVWLILFFWAVMLVFKSQVKSNYRIVHLIFAMMFSPIYILSYYLNNYVN